MSEKLKQGEHVASGRDAFEDNDDVKSLDEKIEQEKKKAADKKENK